MPEFSHTEAPPVNQLLRADRILRRGPLYAARAGAEHAPMPVMPETPEEIEARRLQQLAEQRTMLEHLPKWLRMRGLRQKDVAAGLGVSEATVSAWINGGQQMSVGQLRQIAVLLRAEPGDLLQPPEEAGISAKVEETLGLMDQLSESEWEAVMQTARTIAEAKRRS